MKWYIMNYKVSSGVENMARDLAMMEIAKKGDAALRLYGWKVPTLSLGKFQKLEEINVKVVEEQGFEMVRRPSGGRAVLHMDELTYAVVLPEAYLSKSVIKSYMEISKALVNGLKELGLNVYMARERSKERYTDFAACFATTSLHEIMIDGKKLVGSAQTRKDGVILQHGSIPLHSHIEEYVKCFNLDDSKADLLKRRLADKTTCIFDHIQTNVQKVRTAILYGFSKTFNTQLVPFLNELEWKKYVTEVKIWD